MMNAIDIPKTEKELAVWMQANGYNFNEYSINGNHIHEGFGIDTVAGRFRWYYTERGQKSSIVQFETEAEIVVYAFDQIKADKWAKAHCIGFTADVHESQELRTILETAAIEFFEDEIPYSDPERPVYRTFVFGCDIDKTRFLKEKYCRY